MKTLPKKLNLKLKEYSEEETKTLEFGYYLVVNSNGVMNLELFNGNNWSTTSNTKINWFYFPKIK